MKIESKIGRSPNNDQEIYAFITDFKNFKQLLPETGITEWEASDNSCSFHMSPVGRTGLEIVEKTPYKLVKIASIPEFSSYQFTIWIQIKKVAENDSRVKITIEPLVNKMLLPMIRGPLKSFADTLIDKIEGFDFQN